MSDARGPTGDWDRTKQLLQDALDLAPEARRTFLHEQCGGDRELLEEVESLLVAHEEADRFLDTPPTAVFSLDGPDDDRNDERAGQRLGAYRIERHIGRGGAGSVYLARRDDDQFRRQVAIKVLRRGVATREALDRFGSERQILATIDHPNIARLLDAGTTPDGLPYLVMEYVEGLPIDEYCDSQRLSVRERLELFETVCEAVQVAHQNLVVHRDLKPGNILVTPEGAPKLLDFGIAKLLDPALVPDTTDPTRDEHRVMTPEFASPEQVRGESVTTASDVYSLGVLLFLLLTGERPLRLGHLPLAEMEREIGRNEPGRPSSVAVRTSAEIAAARRSRPERLARALRGDLDNIVLRALRKEPQRRYRSVEQLADDLRRHRIGLPVRARPDTWSYRARKFVGRHRLPVAVAVSALLVGLVFTIALARQSRRLEVERDRAAAEARKATVVAGFLQEILGSANPLQGAGRDTTVASALETALPEIESTFTDQPDMEAAVRHSVGETLFGLGRLEEAEAQVRRALELRRVLDDESERDIADSLNLLGEIRYENDGLEEARSLYREALEIRRRLFGDENPDLARTVDNLANIAHDYGDLDEAEGLYREALAMRQRLLGPHHRDIASSLNNLAVLAQDRDRLEEAEQLHRESLAMTRRVLGPDHPEVASGLNNLATILHDRGDLEAAEPLYREAVEIARNELGEGHPSLIVNVHNLASLLDDLGRLPEAEALYLESLEMTDATYGDDHIARFDVRFALADLMTRQNRLREAEGYYAEMVEIADQSLSEESMLTLDLKIEHGLSRARLGDWAAAEPGMLAAWEAGQRRLAEAPDEDRPFFEDAVRDFAERMATFYELAGRPERARSFREPSRPR